MFLAAARRRAVGGTPQQTKVIADFFSTLDRNRLNVNTFEQGWQNLDTIEQTPFVRHVKVLMRETYQKYLERQAFWMFQRAYRKLYDVLEKHLHTNLGDVWERDPSTELIRELVDHPMRVDEMKDWRQQVHNLVISELRQPSKAPVGRVAVQIYKLLKEAIELADSVEGLPQEQQIRIMNRVVEIQKKIRQKADEFVQTQRGGYMRGGRRDEIGIRQQRLYSLPIGTDDLQRELDGMGPSPTPAQLNQWDERFNRLREEVEAAQDLLSLA